MPNPFDKIPKPVIVVAIIVMVAVAGYMWGDGIDGKLNLVSNSSGIRPQTAGGWFGKMPAPTQPKIAENAAAPFVPKTTKKIMIQHIPILDGKKKMPHAYWGGCSKCHLSIGGPPAGSQWKSPVGSVMEKASAIHKIGPPILPDSVRPHPAAGRCIKCHDIVIEVPI